MRSAPPSSSPHRLALVVVVPAAALGVALLLFASPGCPATPPLTQPSACEVALACYFGIPGGDVSEATTLPNEEGFRGLFPEDPTLIDGVYGEKGSCWTDPDVAVACEERCKGLLWQDCAFPYVELDPVRPFCGQACNPQFMLPCHAEKVQGSDEPRETSCPERPGRADGCVFATPEPEEGDDGCCVLEGVTADPSTCSSEL